MNKIKKAIQSYGDNSGSASYGTKVANLEVRAILAF